MKTASITLSEAEILALSYLAENAASGWGEPFKDWYEMGRDDVDPDRAIKSALRKLHKAAKSCATADD